MSFAGGIYARILTDSLFLSQTNVNIFKIKKSF